MQVHPVDRHKPVGRPVHPYRHRGVVGVDHTHPDGGTELQGTEQAVLDLLVGQLMRVVPERPDLGGFEPVGVLAAGPYPLRATRVSATSGGPGVPSVNEATLRPGADMGCLPALPWSAYPMSITEYLSGSRLACHSHPSGPRTARATKIASIVRRRPVLAVAPPEVSVTG
ncbi:MAG TPA: hypothetical protein VIY28_17355 [Pseudonocardiaceae bacterium]